jgi:hypothetical protein
MWVEVPTKIWIRGYWKSEHNEIHIFIDKYNYASAHNSPKQRMHIWKKNMKHKISLDKSFARYIQN